MFFDPDDGKARSFIRKMGFELHTICMADCLPAQIASLKGTPEADSAVQDVFKKMMFWELTVAENTEEKIVDSNVPFIVECSVKNGIKLIFRFLVKSISGFARNSCFTESS